ncbi:MAG: glycosyltransferase [Nitrospirae bacterium]|nr:glycosyltransferase [Nitrospirota bacterium]
MKILLVIESSGGGSSKCVIDLAKFLLDSGHEVHLIYSPLRMDYKFEKSINELISAGLFLYSIPMKTKPSFSDFWCILLIRRYIVSHGPFNIIHGHSSKGGALSRLSAVFTASKKVFTPHTLITMDPQISLIKKQVYKFIEHLLFFITDAVITVSEQEYDHCVDMGFAKDKLYLIPIGIDIYMHQSKQYSRENFNIPNDHVCVGFVGHNLPAKSVHTLIGAFKKLILNNNRCSLILVGNGFSPIHSLISDLQLDDHVFILGELDGYASMFLFDIFALSSRYETGPYVVLEAMQAGLPIVTTEVGRCGLYVVHKGNGFIVPVNDEDSLLRALVLLTEDKELRRSMGKKSLVLVKQFNVQRMNSDILKLYNALSQG